MDQLLTSYNFHSVPVWAFGEKRKEKDVGDGDRAPAKSILSFLMMFCKVLYVLVVAKEEGGNG